MNRKVYVGETMYAIFSSQISLKTVSYVQPCKVLEVTKDGFLAECHNGGEDGCSSGKEYFNYKDIGKGIYFSKDSAELNLNK